jgi:DNA-binding response OmpR family regulator
VIIATEVEDKRKGYTLGADAYFVKPVFRDELVSMLESLTGTQARRQATDVAGPGPTVAPLPSDGHS